MLKNKSKITTWRGKRASSNKIGAKRHRTAPRTGKLETHPDRQKKNKDIEMELEEPSDGFNEGDFGFAYLG